MLQTLVLVDLKENALKFLVSEQTETLACGAIKTLISEPR
jgi:hypothetical protein